MTRLTGALAVAVVLGSVSLLHADRPPDDKPPGSVQGVVDLGPISWDSRITGRDGGLSARWRDGAIWVFGDTIMTTPGADGDNWADNSSAITTDLDATDGVSLRPPDGLEHPDAANTPGEYLPYSPWERQFNDRNDPASCGTAGTGDCGKQYFLWPGPVAPDPERNRILFFLTSGQRGGAIEEYEETGSAIAVWDADTGRTTRPRQRRSAVGAPPADHWTMFGPEETRYATMALTVGDTLYVYGCDHKGHMAFDCSLARVPLAHAVDRQRWRFYTGARSWSSDPGDAATLFRGGHAGSVFYNTHLKRYLAVYGFGTAYYRTAPRPWGPWSAARPLFETTPPDSDFNYFVLAHPEYGAGRTLYVTYSRPTGNTWEVRLTEVTLA